MVCKSIDMFIVNSPMWIAQLSNGETIYQDDDRPEYEEKIAWLRLAKYIEENNLNIVGLGIRYRTNSLWTKSEQSGYYFTKVAGADWDSSKTDHFYKIGYLDGETVQTFQYRIPELVLFHTNFKKMEDCMPGTLIINGQKTNQAL